MHGVTCTNSIGSSWVISVATDGDLDISCVVSCIKEEMSKMFAGLRTVFDNSIEVVSAEMFSAGIISTSKQSSEAIITDFQSGFLFMSSLSEIQQHCSVFFGVLDKLGGPSRIAGNYLKKAIKKRVEEKFNIEISFFVDADE